MRYRAIVSISYAASSGVPKKGVTVVDVMDKLTYEAAKTVPPYVPNP